MQASVYRKELAVLLRLLSGAYLPSLSLKAEQITFHCPLPQAAVEGRSDITECFWGNDLDEHDAVGRQVQFGAMETELVETSLVLGQSRPWVAGAGGCLVLGMASTAHLPLLEVGVLHSTWQCCRGPSMTECKGHSAGRGISAARALQPCCLHSQSSIRLPSIWHTGCWSFV